VVLVLCEGNGTRVSAISTGRFATGRFCGLPLASSIDRGGLIHQKSKHQNIKALKNNPKTKQ
jgi:hypothetical protein